MKHATPRRPYQAVPHKNIYFMPCSTHTDILPLYVERAPVFRPEVILDSSFQVILKDLLDSLIPRILTLMDKNHDPLRLVHRDPIEHDLFNHFHRNLILAEN